MRRAPAVNIPLSRVPERQGAPRSVLPALVTVAEADYSHAGGDGQAKNLAASERLDLPALVIDRHPHDLVHSRRRLGLLRRAKAQVREDLRDGYLVVEVGHDLELPPALATPKRVGMKDLRDQTRPARGTAALLGWLLIDLGLCRLLPGAISAHSIGIVAVVRIPVIVIAGSGIVISDSADREHAVGAKRR